MVFKRKGYSTFKRQPRKGFLPFLMPAIMAAGKALGLGAAGALGTNIVGKIFGKSGRFRKGNRFRKGSSRLTRTQVSTLLKKKKGAVLQEAWKHLQPVIMQQLSKFAAEQGGNLARTGFNKIKSWVASVFAPKKSGAIMKTLKMSMTGKSRRRRGRKGVIITEVDDGGNFIADVPPRAISNALAKVIPNRNTTVATKDLKPGFVNWMFNQLGRVITNKKNQEAVGRVAGNAIAEGGRSIWNRIRRKRPVPAIKAPASKQDILAIAQPNVLPSVIPITTTPTTRQSLPAPPPLDNSTSGRISFGPTNMPILY